MANTETAPAPAWEVSRTFSLATGGLISRPVAVVNAASQDEAITKVAETIRGIAMLKARECCRLCGRPPQEKA